MVLTYREDDRRADIPSDPGQIPTKGFRAVFSTTGCPDEQQETLPKSDNHKWVKSEFLQRWPPLSGKSGKLAVNALVLVMEE